MPVEGRDSVRNSQNRARSVCMGELDTVESYFKRAAVGCDPRAATCRSKLQTKRAKLNQEINKELRLRAGAENLFRATSNKKLRETVALELSFVNSNLQLLKEQLAELNSSVEVYQSEHVNTDAVIPMIPLGLKETKEINFQGPLKDFIREHYHEKEEDFEEAIAEFADLRQAMRTPTRDAAGITLLYEYYNQLYYLERRFFSVERPLPIFFEWYDSLTGVPSSQRTVAFEKACVLFNLAALHTQLGARQERGRSTSTAPGLDSAVDQFLRAAAVFRYIIDNFTNAPSMDLSPELLDAMVQLMMAQARECLFEKFSVDEKDMHALFERAQEAAQVCQSYRQVETAFSVPLVRDYIPGPWLGLVQVKTAHYQALAHFQVGFALARHNGQLLKKARDTLAALHSQVPPQGKNSTMTDIRVPIDDAEKMQLAKCHLREAVLLHEEAQRLQRMCRELKKREHLTTVLARSREASWNAYVELTGDSDLSNALDPPPITPATKFQLSFGQPDFGQYEVSDPFKALGPLSLFSSKHHWSAARDALLKKLPDQGFGFSVRGEGPVIIAGVDGGSIADLAGMKEGDVIVGIADKSVKWASHEDVVTLIRRSRNVLNMRLVSPLDKPVPVKQVKSIPKPGRQIVSPTSTTSSCSSSGVSSSSNLSHRILSPVSSLSSAKSMDNFDKKFKASSQPRFSLYYPGTERERGRTLDRKVLGFRLSRTVSRERVHDTGSSTWGKLTWNLFRRGGDKSREKLTKKPLDDGRYKSMLNLR